jgi:hypothetical protein
LLARDDGAAGGRQVGQHRAGPDDGEDDRDENANEAASHIRFLSSCPMCSEVSRRSA